MISMKVKGALHDTNNWLKRMMNGEEWAVLDECGKRGVEALKEATPKRTGLTAESWRYEVYRKGKNIGIRWINDNRTSQGDVIALLIQYGHGTGRGTYVQGRDYINPAIAPVFDSIAEDVWKVVTS